MSPTLLQATVGLIAAVLVFMFALRVVPLIIEQLAHYFDRTLYSDRIDEKEPDEYES